jgi:hypothetical protein
LAKKILKRFAVRKILSTFAPHSRANIEWNAEIAQLVEQRIRNA